MVVHFARPPRSSDQGHVGVGGSQGPLTLGIVNELLCSVILLIRLLGETHLTR